MTDNRPAMSDDDYFRIKLEEARAENTKRDDKDMALAFLVGYYGAEAKRSRSAGLAALVEKLEGVLDGTLDFATLRSKLSSGGAR